MKKILVTTIAMLILSAPAFAKDTCNDACSRYIECTEELMKTKASAEQRKTLNDGCMNACKKQTAKVNKCYNVGKNSCQSYASCVMEAMQKK